MKKLFIILTTILIQINTSLAYSPTIEDKTLLDTIKTRLEKILKPETQKNIPLANAVNNLKEKYKTHERMTYILNELEIFIRNYWQDTDIDDNNLNDEDFKPCDRTLENLTNKLQKQTFYVSSEQEIRNILSDAKNRTNPDLYFEIVIAKWKYTLSNGFRVDADKIIFRWETGNPDDVILQWKWMNWSVTHIFRIIWDNIKIWDIKIGNVANHAIQIMWEKDADYTFIHNIKIFNTNEQMIKWSYDANSNKTSNDGVIECSSFYYTDGFWPQYYIGWIDIHHGENWTVQFNKFRNITSPETKLAEHAIHFRSDSKNITVSNNIILNCDRWIWFWLWSRGVDWGLIENNTIYHNYQRWDVWIWLENAKNITVHDNTIYFENNYANAIEYRFTNSINNKIFNNKTNKNISSRDNWQAEVYENNTSLTKYDWPK